MMRTCNDGAMRRGISARMLGAVTMAVLFAACAGVKAQGADVNATANTEVKSYVTLYLSGANDNRGMNDIVTDMRNMLPRAKVYFVSELNAVSIYGTEQEIGLAKQVLAGVDRPRKSYRLTYILTETGGSQAEQTQKVAMLVVSGGSAEVKQGTRVPIVTSTTGQVGSNSRDEVQYLDVGMRIKAILDGTQDHLRLHTMVEQSQLAQGQTSGAVASDPVIRQTSLDGTSTVAEGGPVALGSIDLPGTDGTRKMKVEVTVEPAS